MLAPELHNEDLAKPDCTYFAPKITELGNRLFERGCLPGLPSWESEESPEFVSSIDLWDQASEEESATPFNSLVQASFLQAEAAFGQMGRLASRMAALRWCCCMCWLAARSNAVDAASAGGHFGTVGKADSREACKEAKMTMIGWLIDIAKNAPILAVFDLDLVGHGVWRTNGKEPVMREAYNEWFRRGAEYDIVRLFMQVADLPPAELNPSIPTFRMVQPLGILDLHIPPPEVPRRIIDRHDWLAITKPPPLDTLPAKAPITGLVLFTDTPPEPQFDFDNPEIIAKVQRGEDLGKGDQEEGLPGAVHGSIGLLFAAMCWHEKIINIHFTKEMLEVEGCLEYILKYGPPFRSLDLSGCDEAVDEDIIKLLALAGDSVTVLDLSDCGLYGDCVDALVEALVELTGVRHLDLAGNKLDQDAAVLLVGELSERRLDVASVRLDGNPFGEATIIRDATAIQLAKRGATTVAGGDLVLHFGNDAVRWAPARPVDQPLERLREGDDVLRLTSLKDLRQSVQAQKRRLDEFEATDPNAKTEEGQRWLQAQRKQTETVLHSDMMRIYRRELASRAKTLEGAPPAKAGEASPAGNAKAG